MYEELIKALKNCGYPGCGHYCSKGCVMSPDGTATCGQTPLLRKAANVIEELSAKYEKALRDLVKQVEQPKWIPVTERLPEEPYGCLAIVWDNPRYDGDMFLNYYPEFVGWNGETWNDADGEEIPLDVVYWMKMPQIPEPQMEGE